MQKEQKNDVKKKYMAMIPTLEQFALKLASLLSELLDEAGIDCHQIEHRVKSSESLQDKIQRKGQYSDPFQEVTDLVGLRLIAYYPEDVELISTMIAKEFEVDKSNSSNRAALLDPDRFGYASVHYVVNLPSRRTRLTEWKRFSRIKVEIQIRTVLQHAWAAISHKLEYKTSPEAPRPLRRSLHRLSALLELADEEFSRLRLMRSGIVAEYSERVDRGELSLELDASSLAAFSESSALMKNWIEKAHTVGFSLPDKKEYSDFLGEWLFQLFRQVGLQSVQDLKDLMESASSWGEAELKVVFEGCQGFSFSPWANANNILSILVVAANKDKLAPGLFELIDEEEDKFKTVLRDRYFDQRT